MPIDNRNFENFFVGTSAELHVASLFYFAGYEASKVNPDAGIDYLVTNIARSKILGEDPKRREIQVKSTLLDSKGASFCLTESDLDFLSEGENRYTVFVLLHGFTVSNDPTSFDIYADRVDKMLDRDIAQYQESLMKEKGRTLKRDSAISYFEFGKSSFTTFWLHSAQIRRMRSEELWVRSQTGEPLYFLNVRLVDEQFITLGKDIHLIPELNDVRYIIRDCKSSRNILEGKFAYEHL